jgi:hypothetical protein
MTDIVIPLGTGSRWQDNELRYALRSIEKNLSDYRDIYIVGHPRKWLRGIKWIEAEELYTRKERCIFEKIIKACEHQDISDTFLFTNDDIFFLEPISANEIKNWYSGTVDNLLVKSAGVYKYTVLNTLKWLQKKNSPTRHYDIHVPILYNKERFMQLMQVDWERDHIIKSLYGNLNHLEGEEMRDLKFGRPFTRQEIRAAISGRKFFSISENGTNDGMKEILQQLFPEPSRYEITSQ